MIDLALLAGGLATLSWSVAFAAMFRHGRVGPLEYPCETDPRRPTCDERNRSDVGRT